MSFSRLGSDLSMGRDRAFEWGFRYKLDLLPLTLMIDFPYSSKPKYWDEVLLNTEFNFDLSETQNSHSEEISRYGVSFYSSMINLHEDLPGTLSYNSIPTLSYFSAGPTGSWYLRKKYEVHSEKETPYQSEFRVGAYMEAGVGLICFDGIRFPRLSFRVEGTSLNLKNQWDLRVSAFFDISPEMDVVAHFGIEDP